MKAISLSKTDSNGDPRLWIRRAVTAEMVAEAARKFARLTKDKYKQARKAFKEARRNAKQARKKAMSAARTFGTVAGEARKGKRAKSVGQMKVTSQKAAATSLRSSSSNQLNHQMPPAPAPPTSKLLTLELT
jgi:hypothetical protein